METIPNRIRTFSEEEWQKAWVYTPRCGKLLRQFGSGHGVSHRETLFHAAYFVAGRLHEYGFSLFQNGGQPLLRRDHNGWSEEILFHVPPTGVNGFYSPVSVEMLVQMESLKEIRRKYTRSATMVPAFLASVNLGAFEYPPCRVLWNLESDGNIKEISDIISDAGFDWIESLCDPLNMEEQVIGHQLPGVDDVTGLEMILALGGRNAAARVIREWLEDSSMGPALESEIERLSHAMGPVYRSEDDGSNLAVLCICYDLLSPFRNKRRSPRDPFEL